MQLNIDLLIQTSCVLQQLFVCQQERALAELNTRKELCDIGGIRPSVTVRMALFLKLVLIRQKTLLWHYAAGLSALSVS